MKKLEHIINLLVGGAVTGLGVVFALTALTGFLIDESFTLGIGILFASLSASFIWTGVKGIKKTLNAKKKALIPEKNSENTPEIAKRKILKLAFGSNNKLTASEVALNTDISLEKASKLLDTFHTEGYAELQMSESGAVVYHFHELLSKKDKDNTVGLLS